MTRFILLSLLGASACSREDARMYGGGSLSVGQVFEDASSDELVFDGAGRGALAVIRNGGSWPDGEAISFQTAVGLQQSVPGFDTQRIGHATSCAGAIMEVDIWLELGEAVNIGLTLEDSAVEVGPASGDGGWSWEGDGIEGAVRGEASWVGGVDECAQVPVDLEIRWRFDESVTAKRRPCLLGCGPSWPGND